MLALLLCLAAPASAQHIVTVNSVVRSGISGHWTVSVTVDGKLRLQDWTPTRPTTDQALAAANAALASEDTQAAQAALDQTCRAQEATVLAADLADYTATAAVSDNVNVKVNLGPAGQKLHTTLPVAALADVPSAVANRIPYLVTIGSYIGGTRRIKVMHSWQFAAALYTGRIHDAKVAMDAMVVDGTLLAADETAIIAYILSLGINPNNPD